MLAIFLISVTPLFHAFWALPAGTPEYMMQMGNFSKNIAMLGGVLVLLAMGPGPFSLDARAARKT
jgi:putative oxidoreductase